jgi:hypothetical protein
MDFVEKLDETHPVETENVLDEVAAIDHHHQDAAEWGAGTISASQSLGITNEMKHLTRDSLLREVSNGYRPTLSVDTLAVYEAVSVHV